MAIPRGLGRGLGSLIPKKGTVGGQEPGARSQGTDDKPQMTVASAAGVPLLVPIERVLPNPHQPRTRFGHGEIEDLVASVKTHGILQPLVVTERKDGTYELIAGERRLRAARLAGLTAVPVTLRDAEEREKLELALVENIQRQDLNPIEEASAYRRLVEEYGLTQDQVAARVGKSRSVIANTLRLLELPAEIRQAVTDGALAPTAARGLLGLQSADEQIRWWQKMAQEKLTVRDIEEAARRIQGPRKIAIPDANLEADEAAIRNSLGTKVAVKKRGEIGTISLAFFSEEEYRALVRRLTALRE